MCRGGGGDDNEEREAGGFGFSFCLRYTSRLGGVVVVVVVVEFGLVACCVHACRPLRIGSCAWGRQCVLPQAKELVFFCSFPTLASVHGYG
jgi:hypothetical protein